MKKSFVLTIIFVIAAVTGVSAQANVENAIQNAKDKFSDLKNRSFELERARREADAPLKPASHEIKFPEIKEDFEQIQLINSELQPNAAQASPDFKAVYQAASEIRKRALRLQANLFAPDAKKKSKKKLADTDENNKEVDLKTEANELEIAISNFIKNSMFQNIQVVNSDDSQRAQKELETVVKLSAAIERQTANH